MLNSRLSHLLDVGKSITLQTSGNWIQTNGILTSEVWNMDSLYNNLDAHGSQHVQSFMTLVCRLFMFVSHGLIFPSDVETVTQSVAANMQLERRCASKISVMVTRYCMRLRDRHTVTHDFAICVS